MAGPTDSESKGLLARWPEVQAVVGWWLHSWLKPAGDSLDWEQRAGRGTQHGTGLSPHHNESPQRGGNAGSNRQQNVKETGGGTS
jgi:hypothetical protein